MKTLIKSIAALCILTLIFANIGILFVYADTEVPSFEKPLYEKYGFDENFEYEGEILPHALKTSVPKIFHNLAATISHNSVSFNKELLNQQLQYIYSEYSSVVSEEELETFMLQYLHDNISDYIVFGRNTEADVEAVFEGSGVVVSENGYIATNAHVTNIDEKTKKELYASKISENILNDMEDIFSYLSSLGVGFSEEEIQDLCFEVISIVASKSEVLSEKTQLEVYFPGANGETNPTSATVYDAEVLVSGTSSDVGVEGLTQDTAIIKIDADNLVALKLSDSYPELNTQLVSAGFPVASDAVFRMSGSDEATLSITVGNGTVSRHVPISGSQYQAIEINLTISGGNSGGPSVDKHLHVEGLNTYANAQDNRYAYMISAEYVSTLLDSYSPYQGEASKTFLLGLQMLQQDFGATAVECFEKVKQLQPDTPYIEKIIETAKNAPQNSYKKQGDFTLLIIIGVVIIVMAGIGVLIVVLVRKGKKKKVTLTPKTPYTPPVYTPPVHTPHTYTPPAPSRPASPTFAPPTSAPAKPTTKNEFLKKPGDL